MYVEPVYVWGIFPKFQKTVELEESTGAMVENAVKYDFNSHGVGFAYKIVEIFQCSKNGVYFEVVHRVIAVIGIALENRAEIDCVCSKLFDVF